MPARKGARCLQAGEKVRAMRALLQTHDRDRILVFANAARDSAVYLLAAQYLQTATDWRNEDAARERIVQLFSRAKSPMHLAQFHENRAAAALEAQHDCGAALAALQVWCNLSLLMQMQHRDCCSTREANVFCKYLFILKLNNRKKKKLNRILRLQCIGVQLRALSPDVWLTVR